MSALQVEAAQKGEPIAMRVETFVTVFVNAAFFGIVIGLSTMGAMILFP
ncbi:hypothetical protein [Consotaella salsifontis]|nr:hypothetical protein [Consotaella salsifontis]